MKKPSNIFCGHFYLPITMRRNLAAPARSLLLQSSAVFRLPFHSPFSTLAPPLKPSAALTEEELSMICHLVPRLCDAGRHDTAVRLLSTVLLTDPPIESLPIPSLSDRLSSLPDMVAAMSLLTSLRHHPLRPSPLPFCSALLASYFRNRRLKEASKVFFWLLRSDSPCRPDARVYRIAVEGFCRLGQMFEALQALKEMMADSIAPVIETRIGVYRGLLHEARIDEARELDATLQVVEESGEGFDGAMESLDRIIREWVA